MRAGWQGWVHDSPVSKVPEGCLAGDATAAHQGTCTADVVLGAHGPSSKLTHWLAHVAPAAVPGLLLFLCAIAVRCCSLGHVLVWVSLCGGVSLCGCLSLWGCLSMPLHVSV